MNESAWTAAGLFDPDAPDAEDRRGLLEYLTSVGFTVDELVANADGLTRLASRRVLFGTEPRMTVAELAERSGCDVELVRRVRLAAGLPDPGDEAACSSLEIGLMQSFAVGAAVFGDEVTLQFTRVLGNAATGIAEAALATFALNRSLPLLAMGGTSAEIAKIGADATVALLGVAPVLDALLREHFDAASNGRFGGRSARRRCGSRWRSSIWSIRPSSPSPSPAPRSPTRSEISSASRPRRLSAAVAAS